MPGVHGGFLVTLLLVAVNMYFTSTLAHLGQLQTSTIHVEFLDRVEQGAVKIEIDDTKIGRRASTVHLKFAQRERTRLVAYARSTMLFLELNV